MPELLLFAYGSLRRDASGAHHALLHGAEFRGSATTTGHLYRVSWHPGLHLDPGGDLVKGELFAIPAGRRAEMLQRLEAYEGHMFRLEPAACRTADGVTHAAWTWAWLGDASTATVVAGGDFGVPPDHAVR